MRFLSRNAPSLLGAAIILAAVALHPTVGPVEASVHVVDARDDAPTVLRLVLRDGSVAPWDESGAVAGRPFASTRVAFEDIAYAEVQDGPFRHSATVPVDCRPTDAVAWTFYLGVEVEGQEGVRVSCA